MFKRCDEEGDDWMDTDYEDDFWEYALTLDLGINRDGLLVKVCRVQRQYLSVMNQFKEKLYEEFEATPISLWASPVTGCEKFLAKYGEDIDAEFEAAWDFGGAAFMRQTMSMVLPL